MSSWWPFGSSAPAAPGPAPQLIKKKTMAEQMAAKKAALKAPKSESKAQKMSSEESIVAPFIQTTQAAKDFIGGVWRGTWIFLALALVGTAIATGLIFANKSETAFNALVSLAFQLVVIGLVAWGAERLIVESRSVAFSAQKRKNKAFGAKLLIGIFGGLYGLYAVSQIVALVTYIKKQKDGDK